MVAQKVLHLVAQKAHQMAEQTAAQRVDHWGLQMVHQMVDSTVGKKGGRLVDHWAA
jgi:hypothetical protein